MQPHWVIQSNLGASKDYARMTAACEVLGLSWEPVRAIPFSTELPDVAADGPVVFYGATSFVTAVHRSGRWSPGVFFDEQAFDYRTWSAGYGDAALNGGGEITTLAELARQERDPGESLFVRPTRDLKEFAGTVRTFADLREWARTLEREQIELRHVPIVVAEPVGIAHEWRLFMVQGRVASGSHYRAQQRLDPRPDVPPEVASFAEEQATVYAPSDVFVLDVGQSGDGLYVIEVNCFNGSGFYAADVEQIFDAVSRFVAGRT